MSKGEAEIEALKKKVAALELEKQQIMSMVSHDIKAPLNRIFALVQLMNMEKDNFTDDQLAYLDKMHIVVADGLGLIRNLSDYRNLEYKKTELLIEKVNLSSVAQLVGRNFQTVAQKKKVTIQSSLQKDVTLISDHHSIIRILENLFSNAVKFAPEKSSVAVRVSEDQEHAYFSIHDEGPGFTAEDLPEMFKKFQKLSGRPTGGESTTGLGLYLIKTFAERIGIVVTFSANEVTGTTFTVTIPKAFRSN